MRIFFSSVLPDYYPEFVCKIFNNDSKDLFGQRRLLVFELVGLSNLVMKSITYN